MLWNGIDKHLWMYGWEGLRMVLHYTQQVGKAGRADTMEKMNHFLPAECKELINEAREYDSNLPFAKRSAFQQGACQRDDACAQLRLQEISRAR